MSEANPATTQIPRYTLAIILTAYRIIVQYVSGQMQQAAQRNKATKVRETECCAGPPAERMLTASLLRESKDDAKVQLNSAPQP